MRFSPLGTFLRNVPGYHVATVLSENGGKLDLVAPEDAKITEQVSVDGSRKIGSLSYDKASTITLANGTLSKAWNRGALGGTPSARDGRHNSS